MLTIDITGLKHVEENLGAEKFLRAISTGMDSAGNLAVGDVQARRLTHRGPHSLGIKSERLRNSLTHTKPTIQGRTVFTLVGSNVTNRGVSYPAVHEYGTRDKRLPARQWLSRGLTDASHFFTSEIEKELLEEMNK